MSALRLDANDRRSTVWIKIKAHLTAELDLLRRKNDNDYDAVVTAELRGNIARIKALLAAGGEANEPEEVL
jgi:hypothetical protein